MTDRLNEIFGVIDTCDIFADIGCDHGYMAQKMLDSGKCKKAIIADVSAKCLEKAKTLLSDYIKGDKCDYYVSNGFDKIPYCDLALIAGMGGEETVKILTKAPYKPQKLVLQPMKNAKELRLFLASIGYRIEKDYIFYAGGKYYVLISAVLGEDELSLEEAELGRTNIKELSADFIRWAKGEKEKLLGYLTAQNLSAENRNIIEEKIKKLEKYV